MFLNDLVKEFVFDCEIRKISKRTIKTYKNNIMQFVIYIQKEFEITDVEAVSPMYIKKYLQYMIGKGLTASYANSSLKAFRAFFKYCLLEEYISKSPCDKVQWQREGKVLIKTFTDEEVLNMLKVYNSFSYLDTRNRTILAFMIDTGARNYETCCLKSGDIQELVIKILGKGNKERYVAISPQLKKYMIKYERIRENYFKDKNLKDDNYFLSRTGRPLTIEAMERVVRLAGEQAGVRSEIRCSPHTFRHYFAQTQLKNGLDVYSLSRLLGHENISITKRYLQSINDDDIVRMSIKTSPLMNLR